MEEVGPELVAHLRDRKSDVDGYACSAKDVDASPGDVLIGIGEADHDPAHASLDEGVGARWRTAMVRARLEGDIHRRASRCRAGATQSDDLGVWATRRARRTIVDRAVRGDDDTPDPWVG